jgi:hypothetical protein
MVGTLNKTRWRLSTVNTITVDIGCTDIAAVMNSCGCGNLGACTALEDCFDRFFAASGQINNDYAHVYVTDTMGCNADTYRFRTLGNRIFIVASNSTGAWYNEDLGTRILAHELGHGLGLAYVDHPWSSCDSGQAVNRNLMCSNAGRLLQGSQPPQQCANIRNSSGYLDRR